MTTTTFHVRREGDAILIGTTRVTVAFVGADGRVLLCAEHEKGVAVKLAEVAEAIQVAEPKRRASA